jgi:predicted TIM-barrel fold metal-dependent hydrolase
MYGISRRSLLMSMLAPREPVIDTHVHLFDPAKFPYHPNATYKPPPAPAGPYLAFAKEAGITGAVIVHPEPYQDDHTYLEHCFKASPIFKGTCLFDPTSADTPSRMRELVGRNKGRVVALRIHQNRARGAAPTTSGSIRDRDLSHANVRKSWRTAGDLGLAIQMHFIPVHAPSIATLAREFNGIPVVLDHMARAGQGTPEEYNAVLAMAKLGNVFMKFSGLNYSSKQKPPYADLKDLVKRTFDAFGPDRMIWGVLGMNMRELQEANSTFDEQLRFASAADRAKVRGLTAARLYRFA